MKKIYTFTLESDDYPSRNYGDDIRLIASLVYDYIYNYDGENANPLNINESIRYNNISYGYYNTGRYMFDSDMYDDGYINYEPFLSGRRTFCLTIADDSFDINIIRSMVNYVLSLLKLKYNISIDYVPYEAKDIDDESHRDEAINKIHDEFAVKYVKRNKLVRLLKGQKYRGPEKISTY